MIFFFRVGLHEEVLFVDFDFEGDVVVLDVAGLGGGAVFGVAHVEAELEGVVVFVGVFEGLHYAVVEVFDVVGVGVGAMGVREVGFIGGI